MFEALDGRLHHGVLVPVTGAASLVRRYRVRVAVVAGTADRRKRKESGYGEATTLVQVEENSTTASVDVLLTVHTLLVDQVTAEVIAALRERQVAGILLKGPSIAAWLYDDGALRSYNDCDLSWRPSTSRLRRRSSRSWASTTR